jgi:signal transduction histidine kinase/CHASE3 domain sensor protein
LRGTAASVGAIRNLGGIAQRMLFASVALALVVGAVFAILLVPIQGARNAERSALHSQDVLIAAHGLEQRVLDLETGQRGFILTRQPRFLMPWQQAREELPQQERALLELVRGDSAQEGRVREIVRAVRSYIDDYSLPLVNAASRADPSARTVAATAEGEARTRVIRADFAQLLQAERRTSAASARASASAAHRAYAGVVVGIGASIALVALYAGYLTRAIVGPIQRAATLAGRVAGGDLTARLPETGVGEVGALQRAFNIMAASLERDRDELTALAKRAHLRADEARAHARKAEEAEASERRLADEQTALRRVATLVAQGLPTQEIFEAVTREVGLLCDADFARMERFGPDDAVTAIAAWARDDRAKLAVGSRFALEGASIAAQVRETGRPARVDSFVGATGPIAREAQRVGIRASVGCPITVDGRLWGVIAASTTRGEPFPADTESRIADFTQLVATAISNADARADLVASRERLLTAGDEARRHVVRDLHDGAQQRFVHAILTLELALGALETDEESGRMLVAEALEHAKAANEELRELAHGVLPEVLIRGGLAAGVEAIVSRLRVPVDVSVPADRFPSQIEASAYFVVAEALTNVAKHSDARHANVAARLDNGNLRIDICDDGAGGARPDGSGLLGVRDRVVTLGGQLEVDSPPGGGTRIAVTLPLQR